MLFLEHDPLETLQPTVRLLAVAVIEKDVLFVFKPFEVVTSYVYIYICIMSFLMVFFLLTGQGLILRFLFFFFFLFKYETSSYLKDAFLLLVYYLILLFSHTSFLLTFHMSIVDVCLLYASSQLRSAAKI